jgi:hypothetical protein
MTARERRGQASTEYLVLISALVIATVAAAWAFYPYYRDGLTGLNADGTHLLDAGTRDGSNDRR